MSSFSPDDVRRLASLARLQLSDAEIASFARQLGEILDFARQVQSAGSLPDDAADPTTGTVLSASPATRDDEVRASLAREAALGGAPEADARAGLFKVPRVLNG